MGLDVRRFGCLTDGRANHLLTLLCLIHTIHTHTPNTLLYRADGVCLACSRRHAVTSRYPSLLLCFDFDVEHVWTTREYNMCTDKCWTYIQQGWQWHELIDSICSLLVNLK